MRALCLERQGNATGAGVGLLDHDWLAKCQPDASTGVRKDADQPRLSGTRGSDCCRQGARATLDGVHCFLAGCLVRYLCDAGWIQAGLMEMSELERASAAATQRELERVGALAALRGARTCFLIHKPNTLIGRSTVRASARCALAC